MLSTDPFEVPEYLVTLARELPGLAVAVAGADHPVALESARRAAETGAIEPVLIGDADAIRAIAKEAGWELADTRILHEPDEEKKAEVAAALAKGREVAVIMKGHVHTDALMRAVLRRDAGLRTDRRTSHVFHMTVPGREGVLHVTDAVVNVQPDSGEMLDIINNAVDLAHALGTETPHIALLSGAEVVNPSMPSSVRASEVAARAADGEVKGGVVDGPFGLDNAISLDAAQLKGIDSPVAGNADILVVPNIEAGNILFKQMVYFLSATAAGVVMGTKVPIVLTSRADPPEARLAATYIAAIVAVKAPRD
ncbi:MAG: phosphate acetyltransferase [Alphaproteobacteria bacterium]|nr:phosphate acetyltransferase [Alphaproteobacteria bacterium]